MVSFMVNKTLASDGQLYQNGRLLFNDVICLPELDRKSRRWSLATAPALALGEGDKVNYSVLHLNLK